eukprot:365334-Chlamydomonas_euryale.AAC.9
MNELGAGDLGRRGKHWWLNGATIYLTPGAGRRGVGGEELMAWVSWESRGLGGKSTDSMGELKAGAHGGSGGHCWHG